MMRVLFRPLYGPHISCEYSPLTTALTSHTINPHNPSYIDKMNNKTSIFFIAILLALLMIFSTAAPLNKRWAKPCPYANANMNKNIFNPYFNITADDLYTLINHDKPKLYIIDVREEVEFRDDGHIPFEMFGRPVPVYNIPLGSLKDALPLLPNNMYFVVHCKGGVRSLRAINEILHPAGFQDLYNLVAGFDSWKPYYPVEYGTNPPLPPTVNTKTQKTAYELALEALDLN